MKERPILFQGAMVRAILAGTKTQTRRAWRVQPPPGVRVAWVPSQSTSPYGVPGDRLWVRETFARIDGQTQPWIETDYRATYTHGDRLGDHCGIKKRWTPAIHMPRAASRITLEVTGVRVERLQEISEADAIAEGLESIQVSESDSRWLNYADPERRKCSGYGSAVDSYRSLWEQINGAGSWEANPFVWVVEFKRC